MDENYYQKIITEIRDDLKRKEIDKAQEKLEEELRMPYIPKLYRDDLEKMDRDIQAIRKENRKPTRIEDPDELIRMLQSEAGQFAVVASLGALNLRNYDDVLKQAFAIIKDRALLAVLVELCARQQLRSEYTFTNDHVRYTFIPAALEIPEESEGVDACLKLANQWLENDNPSMLMLAHESIMRLALLRLPVGIDVDEAMPLTLAIVKNLFLSLADVQEWHEFCEKNTIDKERIEALDEFNRF
jgi:hypothetical protein